MDWPGALLCGREVTGFLHGCVHHDACPAFIVGQKALAVEACCTRNTMHTTDFSLAQSLVTMDVDRLRVASCTNMMLFCILG